jgi:hypothetical protein
MAVSTISQAGLDAPISLTSPTLTTPVINSATVSTVTGTAPLYMARAWVNFDGTTATPSTIRGSGNVTSVTKNSTGNYTLNLTTAMSDANAAPVASGQRYVSTVSRAGSVFANMSSTTAVRVFTGFEDTYSGAIPVDLEFVQIAVFR